MELGGPEGLWVNVLRRAEEGAALAKMMPTRSREEVGAEGVKTLVASPALPVPV